MIISVIDFETTGTTENAQAEIIELGRCDIDTASMRIVSRKTMLVRPKNQIPPEAMAVHHITKQMVDDKPHLRDVWDEFWDRLPPMVAAHNADFEKHFAKDLKAEWICTYKCSRIIWPDAPSHSNQTLRYWLNLDKNNDFESELAEPPHRALPDAYVTAFLLMELLRHKTPDQLADISRYPALMKRFTFGKHKGKTFLETPSDYLEWIVNKSDMDEDMKFSATYWLKKQRQSVQKEAV